MIIALRKLCRNSRIKQKGKKKIPQYDTDKEKSDWSKDNTGKNEEGQSETKSQSAKRALKSMNQNLRRSTHQKNPVIWYGYNEYMAHYYGFMTIVAEVCEPESYAKAAKYAHWRAAMEEEIRALDANDTWDMVDPP